MPEQHSEIPTKRIREIFTKVRQFPPGPEREQYLREVCSASSKLRREVEVLLEAEEKAGSFLDEYVIGQTLDSSDEMLGTKIGYYRLVEHLGEGGFGDVYRVEQTEPIQRQLAMKIIKPGMGSREIIDRFMREREALALMDHPNIAHILDAGATEDGRPFFVMDLVCGVPITQYCDEHCLPLEKRLELFRTTCSAVQHAHQKGILHRDLKPSNIVVVEKDGNPIPMVIDFGIAKTLKEELKDHPLVTQIGMFVGTPAYMSPEQVSKSSESLDTRSDVYSLGILLYELIAGVRPFENDTLHRAALAEVQRIICEEYPDKPSTRIRKIGDEAKDIALRQSADTATLVRTLKGDLDWIVMKAIEKDRERRYQGVGDLARDIDRHLTHNPIEAGAPGNVYRLKKFVRRHRFGASITAILIPILLVGFILAIIGFARAKQERDRASFSELIAQVEAVKAQTFRTILLPYIFPSGEETEWGTTNINTSYADKPDEISPQGLKDTLDALSQRVDEELTSQPGLEAEIRKILADSYMNAGLNSLAWGHLEKIIEIQKNLYGTNSIQYADSLASYALFLDNWIEFVPFTLLALDYMETPPINFKRMLKAIKMCEEALEIYRKNNHENRLYILILHYLGQMLPADEQEPLVLEMIRIAEKFFNRDDPRMLLFERTFAEHYFRTGQFEEAEKAYKRILSIAERYDDGPFVWYFPLGFLNYLMLLDKQGELQRAEELCREILKHVETKDRGVSFIYYKNLLHWIYKTTKDPSVNQKMLNMEYHKALNPGRSRVDYNIQISQPGLYRLYVRWDGHNLWSDSFFARVRRVMDGVGGEVADYYGFVRNQYPPDADFASTPAWQYHAGFETTNTGGTTYTTGTSVIDAGRQKKTVPAEWKFENAGMYTLQLMEIEPGVAVDAFILQLSHLPPPGENELISSPTDPDRLYETKNGRVVIEAENFTNRFDGIGPGWSIVPSEQQPRIQFLNYSGSGYLQVLPEPEWIDPGEFEPLRRSRSAREGNWNRSIAYHDEAVRINPSPQNIYQRAKIHQQKSNYDLAAVDCSEVLDISNVVFIRPPYIIDHSRMFRSLCWLRTGRFDEEIDYRIDPDSGIPSNMFSQEYRKTYTALSHAFNGRWQEAYDCIEDNTNNMLLLCFKGDLYGMAGDYKTAREYYLGTSKSLIESYLRLAVLYLMDGDENTYRTAVKGYPLPGADDHYEQMIFLYLSSLGADTCPKPDELIPIASNVEQKYLASANPTVKRQRAEVVGAAYYRAGMFDQSIESLLAAHELEGRTWQGFHSRWMFYLAMAYQCKGEVSSARSWFEQAVIALEEDRMTIPLTKEQSRPLPWFELNSLELLKKEASELLGIDSTPELGVSLLLND